MPHIDYTDTNRAWYAIHTKPNQEQLARINYRNQRLQVYLPQIRTTRSHARRIEEVLRPVFPGYLFLHLAPEERNWPAIAGTRGAIGPVCFGRTFVPVPNWVIADLQAKEDDRGIIAPGAFFKQKLAPGTEVEAALSSGLTVRGSFCSFRGKDNVIILLEILKRQVKTVVSLAQVQHVLSSRAPSEARL